MMKKEKGEEEKNFFCVFFVCGFLVQPKWQGEGV
jgi:hypothetical protein